MKRAKGNGQNAGSACFATLPCEIILKCGNISSVYSQRLGAMIDLTRLNETKIMINEDLIEVIEETPDTVVTLTTGRKLIVKESRQEIKNLVKSFRKEMNE